MLTRPASGLNPQAQSFVSIGIAAFVATERPVPNNYSSEDTNHPLPLGHNSHFSEYQKFRNITDSDAVSDRSHTSGSYEGNNGPATEEDYDGCQAMHDVEERDDEWFNAFFNIEDQPHEEHFQIKSIQLLYPSGFVSPPESDTSYPFHPANRQIHSLQTLLLHTPRPSHNPQLNNCQLHDTDFIDRRPSKLYTTWLTHHLEISDHLFRNICPADLNNTPCEWDELPTGCPLLRLCCTRRMYPVPTSTPIFNSTYAPTFVSHLFSFLPACHGSERQQCIYIHDIAPNCRSIDKHGQVHAHAHAHGGDDVNDNLDDMYQPCPIIAAQSKSTSSEPLASQWTSDTFCKWGHDFEGARLESLWRYWEHRAQARRRGSVGLVKRDRRGRRARVPKRPDVRSLVHVQEVRVGVRGDDDFDTGFGSDADRDSDSRWRGEFQYQDMETDIAENAGDEDLGTEIRGSLEHRIGRGCFAAADDSEYDDEGKEEEGEDKEQDVEDYDNDGDDGGGDGGDGGDDLFEIDKTRFVGRTFHGHYVRMSFELGEKWLDGWYYTFRELRALSQGLSLRDRGWGGEVLEEVCEEVEEDEEVKDEYAAQLLEVRNRLQHCTDVLEPT